VIQGAFFLATDPVNRRKRTIRKPIGEFYVHHHHPVYRCRRHLFQNWDLLCTAHGVFYCSKTVASADPRTDRRSDLALVEKQKGIHTMEEIMIEALIAVAVALWLGVKCIVFAISAIGLFILWLENRSQ
jgi:hypothetical protein